MSDPAQGRVAGWTIEEHLAFDIGFALPRAPIEGLRSSGRGGATGDGEGGSGASQILRMAIRDEADCSGAWNGEASVIRTAAMEMITAYIDESGTHDIVRI